MTQYEIVKDIYYSNLERIDQLIAKSKMPIAFQVLQNFYSKIEDIKTGLESIQKANAFYSSQALVRVLNEHFLVAFYVFTKTRIAETDECASDYLHYYPIFEMMKRDNYNSNLDKSYDKSKTPLQNFLEQSPEFQGDIEEKDIPDLNKRANQFDIRKILKYIQEELPQDDAYKPLERVILDNCRQFNETSTYIHAGRLAELQFLENTPKTDKQQLLSSNALMAEVYATHTLSFVMLLLIMVDHEFIKVYQPVLDFINEKTALRNESGV